MLFGFFCCFSRVSAKKKVFIGGGMSKTGDSRSGFIPHGSNGNWWGTGRFPARGKLHVVRMRRGAGGGVKAQKPFFYHKNRRFAQKPLVLVGVAARHEI